MAFLKTLLIVLISMYTKTVFACDCNNNGEFLKVAPKTELVALIKVTRYVAVNFIDIYGELTPQAMEVEIITIYKGKETRKTILIWGDSGVDCRPYISVFNVGEYYVLALDKNSKTDYYVSICGTYWLNVDKNLEYAVGDVSKVQNKIELKDLKAKFEH